MGMNMLFWETTNELEGASTFTPLLVAFLGFLLLLLLLSAYNPSKPRNHSNCATSRGAGNSDVFSNPSKPRNHNNCATSRGEGNSDVFSNPSKPRNHSNCATSRGQGNSDVFPNPTKPRNHNNCATSRGEGNSGVSRVPSELLLLMNEIPVSSKKYEVIRSLLGSFIEENLPERYLPLREVHRAVLSKAFLRMLSLLEIEVKRWRIAAHEKLVTELMWLAKKMAACDCAEEAVCWWGEASSLAQLALSAPYLFDILALIMKLAKNIGQKQKGDENKVVSSKLQFIRESKVKLLVTWLPPLLRYANDIPTAPILIDRGRIEIEDALKEIISTLEEDEQEMVLSMWFKHFTRCPNSDWPNLSTCCTKWYNASRNRFLLAASASVD